MYGIRSARQHRERDRGWLLTIGDLTDPTHREDLTATARALEQSLTEVTGAVRHAETTEQHLARQH